MLSRDGSHILGLNLVQLVSTNHSSFEVSGLSLACISEGGVWRRDILKVNE